MDLHNFLLKLIQADSLELHDIHKMVLDPHTQTELLKTLLENYETYSIMLKIKNAMGTD